MHFLQAINSDISVLIVCNKTGGTIKGDIYIKNCVCDEVLFVSRQAEGGPRRSLNVRLTVNPWYQGLRRAYLKFTPLSAMFAVEIL